MFEMFVLNPGGRKNPTGIPFSGRKYYRPARKVGRLVHRRRVPLTGGMRSSGRAHLTTRSQYGSLSSMSQRRRRKAVIKRATRKAASHRRPRKIMFPGMTFGPGAARMMRRRRASVGGITGMRSRQSRKATRRSSARGAGWSGRHGFAKNPRGRRRSRDRYGRFLSKIRRRRVRRHAVRRNPRTTMRRIGTSRRTYKGGSMARRKVSRRRGRATRRYKRNAVLAIPFTPNPRRRRHAKRGYRRNKWVRLTIPKRRITRWRMGRSKGKWHKGQFGPAKRFAPNPRRRSRASYRRAALKGARHRRSSSRRRRASNPWARIWRTKSGRFSARRYGSRRRSSRRNGRRRYSRNPVLPMPIDIGFNPYRRNDIVAGLTAPFKKVIDLDFVTGELLPMAGGFFGSRVVSGILNDQAVKLGLPASGLTKHVANLAAAGVVATAVNFVASSETATRVLGGGLFNFFVALVRDLLGDSPVGPYLSDFSDITQEMKDRIIGNVSRQLSGTGDYLTYEAYGASPHLSDYVTSQAMNVAPHLGGASSGGGVADLSTYVDNFADSTLV